jgi:long-chain acyl-CoA synthetase
VQTAVDAANAEVSQAESIRRFRILPGDFSEVGGQLTPTQKVRRMAVTAAYAADIDALYR